MANLGKAGVPNLWHGIRDYAYNTRDEFENSSIFDFPDDYCFYRLRSLRCRGIRSTTGIDKLFDLKNRVARTPIVAEGTEMNTSARNLAVIGRVSEQEGKKERIASNEVSTSQSVRERQPCSSWGAAMQNRLGELTVLPIGWDGYFGQPVSAQCASFVAGMLESLYQDGVPAPSLVPGSDGGLQVEWHRKMFDVELDVLDVQNVVATLVDRHTEEEKVVALRDDFSGIIDWIRLLSDQDGITGDLEN